MAAFSMVMTVDPCIHPGSKALKPPVDPGSRLCGHKDWILFRYDQLLFSLLRLLFTRYHGRPYLFPRSFLFCKFTVMGFFAFIFFCR
jgi:hypothetical protein